MSDNEQYHGAHLNKKKQFDPLYVHVNEKKSITSALCNTCKNAILS